MMKMYRFLFGILATLLLTCCSPTTDQDAPVNVQEALKKHVYYLADKKLEGRLTGTKGEELAYTYINEHFEKFGLVPLDTVHGYLQPFGFTFRKYPGPANQIEINSTLLDTSLYYPVSQSATGKVEGHGVYAGFGIEAPDLNHNDYGRKDELKGKIFIIETSSPDGNHPHSKYLAYLDIGVKIEKAIEKGAAGVVFINRDTRSENPPRKLNVRSHTSAIPVMFLTDPDQLPNNGEGQHILLQTDIVKEDRTGHNVIAYKDNGSPHTVVIGAHYDHLGFGEMNSLAAEEKPAIHHGADDNASGVAVLLEFARFLARDTLTGSNYLFIAFSGEEIGLLGSKAYVSNPLLPLHDVTYMVNMDMVGRLDTNGRLIINGIGTSPAFKPVADSIQMDDITIRTSESGIGPSDHTPFYLKDIPVVHFFTGTHEDYHKPSDVADKVNHKGMHSVLRFIIAFIAGLDGQGKLEFTKTQDQDTESRPRFSVSLGVLPDYLFDGEGMRIEGVREGRPGGKAGLLPGDIVVQIGDFKVLDMDSYMRALGYYRKGDKAKVTVIRDNERASVIVTF